MLGAAHFRRFDMIDERFYNTIMAHFYDDRRMSRICTKTVKSKIDDTLRHAS